MLQLLTVKRNSRSCPAGSARESERCSECGHQKRSCACQCLSVPTCDAARIPNILSILRNTVPSSCAFGKIRENVTAEPSLQKRVKPACYALLCAIRTEKSKIWGHLRKHISRAFALWKSWCVIHCHASQANAPRTRQAGILFRHSSGGFQHPQDGTPCRLHPSTALSWLQIGR